MDESVKPIFPNLLPSKKPHFNPSHQSIPNVVDVFMDRIMGDYKDIQILKHDDGDHVVDQTFQDFLHHIIPDTHSISEHSLIPTQPAQQVPLPRVSFQDDHNAEGCYPPNHDPYLERRDMTLTTPLQRHVVSRLGAHDLCEPPWSKPQPKPTVHKKSPDEKKLVSLTEVTEHFARVSMISWISEIEKQERMRKAVQKRLETVEETAEKRKEDKERLLMKKAYLEQKRMCLLGNRDSPLESEKKQTYLAQLKQRDGRKSAHERLYQLREVADLEKEENTNEKQEERRRRRMKKDDEAGLKRVIACTRTISTRLQKLDMVLKQVDEYEERRSHIRNQKYLREHKQPRQTMARTESGNDFI